MKIPLLLIAGLAASASSALADPVVLFRDTFEVSGPSFDVNFDNDQGRQTGSLAPLTYTQVEDAPEKSQLGNPDGPEALLLAAFGTGGNVSPDASFTTTAGPGGYQYIKFKVNACGPGSSEDVNLDSWVSVVFGKTTQNAYVVSPSGGGAIFRGNGNFQAFTGGAATGDGGYTENFDDYTPVELRFIDAADGNAFDGSADPVTIELYANDPPELISSWESGTNFTENHISLSCSLDGGAVAVHYVDDFEIGVQTASAAGPPEILAQPSRVVVFPQQTATFSVVAGGAAPLSYQWRRNGTDIGGATQSSLTLPEITAADDGEYTVVVSNAQNSVTSAVAALSVVDPVPAVFGTGVDNSGQPLPAYSPDPHYRLISTPESGETILPAVVQDASLDPIVTGAWTNASPASRWIGPAADTREAAGGEYVYEVTFSLDGFEPATAFISGRWATDNDGVDIRLNGQSTGQTNTIQFAEYTTFTLGSGFKTGLNTLEFVVNNAAAGYTGLKAEILFAGAKTAAAPANAAPLIIGRPQPVFGIAGETVALEVLASGVPAAAYQWSKDGAPIAGATAARLELGALSAAAAGTYTVTATNSAGFAVSDPAAVTVLAAVPGLFNTGVDAAGLVLADEEADPHYTLTESANGGDGTTFAVSNIPQPEWLANSETSRWIGPVPSGNSEIGAYLYSTTFDLTGFDAATAVLRGSIASDDLLTGVLLNGVDTRRRNAGPGYNPLQEFTLAGGFVEGMNTLEFAVNNGGAAANPSGLRIENLRAGAVAAAAPGDQPVLSIAPAEAGQVRLSWPVANGAGWTLYRSSDLRTWNAVTAAPVEAGGQFTVTTPLTQEPVAREFFRLQR